MWKLEARENHLLNTLSRSVGCGNIENIIVEFDYKLPFPKTSPFCLSLICFIYHIRILSIFMTYQVITEVTTETTALWDVIPCNLVELLRRFGEMYFHHLQERSNRSWGQYITLKFRKFLHQISRHHISEQMEYLRVVSCFWQWQK
jgi:hypothetical protein